MKTNLYIAAMLAIAMNERLWDSCDNYPEPKKFHCKKCGKEFKPVSHNKTEYCSAECFKTRKAP